jgi:cyanophycinase
MQEVDRLLLERVGGAAAARVVVLPTAAGLEDPASPQRWANLGVRHFTSLGATTDAASILRREDAFDPRWLPLLERADLIYFSGGSPRHLVDTFKGSPAWEVIRLRHAAGAVLAGCSAGAMAFGRVTLQPRRLWSGGPANGSLPEDTWYPALGLVPNVVTLPHFDRWIRRMGQSVLKELAASLPAGVSLVGVDEDTALVDFDGDGVWRVLGRQGVSLIDAEVGEVRYLTGASVQLSTAPVTDPSG